MPDPAVWEDIRVAYETTSETVEEIAARFGLHRSTIGRHASANGWNLRPSGTAALLVANAKRVAGITSAPAPAPATTRKRKTATKSKAKRTLDIASPTRPRPAAGSDTHQLAIIKRLYDVTDAKLGAIEDRIASGAKPNRTDADSEAREIAGILKTIEKLKELSDAFARTSAEQGNAKPGSARADATAALVNDTERLRQDLAERFERLKVGEGDATSSA